MFRIARAPPVVGLALASGFGALLHQTGVHPSWALLSLVFLLRPNSASPRPSSHHLPLVLAFLAGVLLTRSWAERIAQDCRYHLEEGAGLVVQGRLSGRIVEGRGEIGSRRGQDVPCDRPLRFVLARGASGPVPEDVAPGGRIVVRGRWRRGPTGASVDPLRSGYLLVDSLAVAPGWEGSDRGHVGVAGRVQTRLGRLFPTQTGMVEALILARKDGLSPSVREAFARAGAAHLLAISGFHVGVVAGLLLLAGGWLGLAHPTRFLLGSVGVWVYVFLIGLPDAAVRAALILTTLSIGRLGSRAVVPVGALASAFLVFLIVDPGALGRPGFQLSFSGALGLISWGRPIARRLSVMRFLRTRRSLAAGIAAGVSATLATLPLVIWHFGRCSLVGIPVTLLAAPLVSLAIPGILLALGVSCLHFGAGAFLARGVETVLWVFSLLVEWAGSLPFASVWVSRPGLLWGVVGLGLAFLLSRIGSRWWVGRGRIPLVFGALSGFILWPIADGLVGAGRLEMVVLDVGQGDAILLRSPRARWMLIDAGPRTASFDAGARVILPYLRSRGARELDLVVLTHPDMDHVGGAASILEGFRVGGVMDPGLPVGTEVFLDVLEGARAGGVPWTAGESGDSIDFDGVAIRVLWPGSLEGGGGGAGSGELERLVAEDGANALSLVLELRYGAFSALLTGDAPMEVEEALLGRLLSREISVLKVGHHGSRTSTSPELLERLSPAVALVSVGGRNRYGHPHPVVLRRLEAGGVRVARTDENGTLIVRARPDGSFDLHTGRGKGATESVSVDPRLR